MSTKFLRINRTSPASHLLDGGRFRDRLSGCFLPSEGSGVSHEQDDFAIDLLSDSLLAKYVVPSKGTAEKLRAAALEKFFECEEKCRLTNQSLESFKEEGFGAVLYAASMKISRLLGEFRLEEHMECCDFGPGATLNLNRSLRDKAHKFSSYLELTQDASLFLGYVGTSDLWMESTSGLCFSEWSRIITVPKNNRTDRVIAIEPSFNMFLQKGVGEMIRRRLKTVGIDLDRQEPNQEGAKAASVGDLATFDLSAASDTISRVLVERLIPQSWLWVLDVLRTKSGMLDGRLIEFQKWSSMGNGYTFELESLIFWAVCQSVVDICSPGASVLVYGDDIIVPRASAVEVSSALEKCGFTVNTVKSHFDGPYHESCGKHFYAGTDVTPFFIRRPVTTLPDLFLLHNNLWRWLDRNRFNLRVDWSAARLLLQELRSLAPERWREPRIPPYDFGDGAFIGTFDAVRPTVISSSRRTRGWEGFRVEVLVEKAVSSEITGVGGLTAHLHSMAKRKIVPDTEPGVFVKTKPFVLTTTCVQWNGIELPA